MAEAVDAAELRNNLQEYEDQLKQVEALLLADPNNEEYQGIYDGLSQVVSLTRELLAEAEQQQQASAAAAVAAPTSAPVAAITEAPEVRLPSVLPPQVAQQIRDAQQRAALSGQGTLAWAIGAKVQAKYSGDGVWYDSTVSAISVSGNFIVTFDAYGNQEEVQRQDIRLKEEQRAAAETTDGYKGVEAPKRKKVDDGQQELEEMPKWLEIKPTDDEKTKKKKKKLIKSFKSKQRFHQMDTIQKEKANAWKSFVNSKGVKKKGGLRKKTSMFSVAEGSNAKVGVVGSGKGMTDYGKKKKHEFNLSIGNAPQDDE